MSAMVLVRLFAAARTAAGTGHDTVPGATVAEVLDAAIVRYGHPFAEVLPACQVWLNGEPVEGDEPVVDGDELGILPPLSGGHR